jgi:protoporphyrinogen oxidase
MVDFPENDREKATMRVGVLGGGALGLTAALRLAQRGAEVQVLEKESSLGGLVTSFPIGDVYLEKFYHHLFRTDKVIIRIIEELGLGEKLVWRAPFTGTLLGGRIYALDSPLAVLRFTPLPFLDRLRMGLVIAYLKYAVNGDAYKRLEGKTAAEWLPRYMGERAYKVVWEPVFRAKFGAYHDRIAMPWFWSRVHERTTQLGYLRGGFFQVYQRLAKAVTAAGGQICAGEQVQAIRSEDGVVQVRTASGTQTYDAVLATLPTRLFMRVAEGLPNDFRAQYDWGDHYGAHCVVVSLDRSLSPAYWLNINDPGFPFMVAVEHTNFLPREDYGDQVLVYLGNYLPMSHPLYAKTDAEVLDEFLPHLNRINSAFERAWVRDARVFKTPFAQPIVTTDYHAHIPPHTTPLPNVYLANMFQVYPQDRGQNYSMKMAEEVVNLLWERRSHRSS